jgi:hypothetical protein
VDILYSCCYSASKLSASTDVIFLPEPAIPANMSLLIGIKIVP